jgi:eukaryotic-like serine/threonine-protein kinase
MSICPVCKKKYPPAERFCAQDGTELLLDSTQTPDPKIGLLIGNYRLLEKLGEGGMGTVYRAEHPGLGRFAAVKLLRAEYAQDTEIVLRFFDEARAVNKIRHKHIVDVFDLGRTPEGVAYLIAELLIGEDLDRRLKREKILPIEDICSILCQTCDALQAAHSAGIIHRDLKPENLFLCEHEGNPEFVKVVDFGIAKLLEPGTDGLARTKTGIVLGTPHYMSPEQATGKKQLDGRADLYSLGIILYECLSGQTPFRGDTMAGVVMQHVLEKPPPLKKMALNRDIPEALIDLTMRLLEKDPAQRPANAAEVKVVLQKFSKEPQSTTPVLLSVPKPTSDVAWAGLVERVAELYRFVLQKVQGLEPSHRLLGVGVGIGFGTAIFLYLLASNPPKPTASSIQESPLFQAKASDSNLPQTCNDLFAKACDCEAVRVSNCERVQSSIKNFEAQLKAKKTPSKEIEAQLERSCKETMQNLEPIRKQFCDK